MTKISLATKEKIFYYVYFSQQNKKIYIKKIGLKDNNEKQIEVLRIYKNKVFAPNLVNPIRTEGVESIPPYGFLPCT